MTVTLSENQWHKIYKQIQAEYGDAVVLISWNLEQTLGFTVRRHRDYDPVNGHMKDDIRLDFYNASSLTYFQLKYL